MSLKDDRIALSTGVTAENVSLWLGPDPLLSVGIQMMSEISLGVLDGFGMPVEWALRIVVTTFMGKGDIWNCSCY